MAGPPTYTTIPTTASMEEAGESTAEDSESEVVDTGKVKHDNECSYIHKEFSQQIETEQVGKSASATTTTSREKKPRAPRQISAAAAVNYDQNWLTVLEKLKEFHRVNGHCKVPYHKPPMLTPLMQWCHSQRSIYKKGKLRPDRVQALEEIGFLWTIPRGTRNRKSWDQRFADLQAYKEQRGNLHIDRETPVEAELVLNWWCFRQREDYHTGNLNNLNKHRRAQLEALGFDWGDPASYLPRKPPKTPTGDGEEPMKQKKKRPAGDTPDGGGVPAAKRAKPNTPKVPMVKGPPRDDEEWVELIEKVQKMKHLFHDLPDSFPQDERLDGWLQHQKLLLADQQLTLYRMERLVRLGCALPEGVTEATYKQRPARKLPTLEPKIVQASPEEATKANGDKEPPKSDGRPAPVPTGGLAAGNVPTPPMGRPFPGRHPAAMGLPSPHNENVKLLTPGKHAEMLLEDRRKMRQRGDGEFWKKLENRELLNKRSALLEEQDKAIAKLKEQMKEVLERQEVLDELEEAETARLAEEAEAARQAEEEELQRQLEAQEQQRRMLLQRQEVQRQNALYRDLLRRQRGLY